LATALAAFAAYRRKPASADLLLAACGSLVLAVCVAVFYVAGFRAGLGALCGFLFCYLCASIVDLILVSGCFGLGGWRVAFLAACVVVSVFLGCLTHASLARSLGHDTYLCFIVGGAVGLFAFVPCGPSGRGIDVWQDAEAGSGRACRQPTVRL